MTGLRGGEKASWYVQPRRDRLIPVCNRGTKCYCNYDAREYESVCEVAVCSNDKRLWVSKERTTVLLVHHIHVNTSAHCHAEKISREAADNVRRLAGNLFSHGRYPPPHPPQQRFISILYRVTPNRISAQFGRSPTLFTSTTFIHRAAPLPPAGRQPRRCSIRLTLLPTTVRRARA